MKIFLTVFTLTFSLILCSCAKNPPEPHKETVDNNATNVGNSTKTPNYTFTDGFIYHEWEGQTAQIIYIPFDNSITIDWRVIYNKIYNTNPKYPIKKLVTSKYFDIWVDITEGSRDFYNATNMRDVAYDKLIRKLEEHYHKIKNVYGEPSNVDGNGKIELVFHSKYLMLEGAAGYFQYQNIMKNYFHTAQGDVLYINGSKYMNNNIVKEGHVVFHDSCVQTIFHELQHDIFSYGHVNRGYIPSYMQKWINEALSESTYLVLYDGEKGSGRDGIYNGKRYANFNTDAIRNGQYFFNWQEGYLELDNYITAANFMYWLYIHGGGNQIIRDIIFLNPYKSIDIKSVGDAARKNIPALRGKSDADIIKTWHTANLLNSPNSIHGYLNKTTINTGKANRSDGKTLLYQYCAVITTIDMYDVNSSKRGLNFVKIAGDNLLIFNVNNLSFSYPFIAALVRINPNVSRNMRLSSLPIEEEWFDYAFMYGENTTSKDFKTKEDREREERKIMAEIEKEEKRETIQDDFKAELEVIE